MRCSRRVGSLSQFDPGNRHSVSDPLDLLAPSVPNVGGLGAGAGAGAAANHHVDPFPYGAPEQQQQHYDPYSHAPMQMPDARDYGGYNNYDLGHEGGYGADGGYGVAAGMGGAAAAGLAGAGAYGASRRHHDDEQRYDEDQNRYTSSHGHGPSSPPQGYPSAAASKQREADMERQRNRQSYDQGVGGSGNRMSHEGPTSEPDRRSAANSTVYQHTDYGSAMDEEEAPAEIPPK